MSATPPILVRFNAFELDERQMRLTRHDQPVPMPPQAFAVLCALARRPGELVRKTELLDQIWGHRHVSDSVLKTTISDLRAVLGDDAKAPSCIETALRHGHRFIAAVSRDVATPAPIPTLRPTVAALLTTDAPDALIGRADSAPVVRADALLREEAS
jgi:DNA-binding winged helix-turn-helix (wHTH) protein